MKNLYLLLATIGGVVPYIFFMEFIQANGTNLNLFISDLFANPPASGFTSDILISTLVF